MRSAIAISLVLAGCGDEKFVSTEFPNDPLPSEWREGDAFARVWLATGVAGEGPTPADRCETGADFVVATADGEIPRSKVTRHCASYPTLSLPAELRHAGAGAVVFTLGSVEATVEVTAEPDRVVTRDCVELDGFDTSEIRSAAAEDELDEAPQFRVNVTRPGPLVVDAPLPDHFPTARYGTGDLSVKWSGGEAGTGVEILLAARAADDQGQGIVRCWTKDDGAHDIPATLVDPYRGGASVVTVSRILTEPVEIEGWDFRPFWTDCTSVDVFPY